jgi:hypothetical protein
MIQIKNNPLNIKLHGVFAYIEDDRGSAGTQAMNQMWQIIQDNNLTHKGINHWVYLSENKMFVGVELETETDLLEQYIVTMNKSIYYKHIGPYNLLPSIHQTIIDDIKSRFEEIHYPVVEVFGHWTDDQSKLETEIYYFLQ